MIFEVDYSPLQVHTIHWSTILSQCASVVSFSNHQLSTKRSSNTRTITLLKRTSENDFKTNTETTLHHFVTKKHRKSSERSKHIWTLKDKNIDHFISWHIISSSSTYNGSSKRCNLCLEERFFTICRPDLSSLNKRIEIVPSCCHRNKALLRNN